MEPVVKRRLAGAQQESLTLKGARPSSLGAARGSVSSLEEGAGGIAASVGSCSVATAVPKMARQQALDTAAWDYDSSWVFCAA